MSLVRSRRSPSLSLSLRLAAVAAVALLGACGMPVDTSGDLAGGGDPTPGPTTATPSRAVGATPPASPSGTPAGGPWIVSLGDSFISGEAGRWAGNSAGSSSLIDALGPTAYFDAPDGQSELIPLCHRSKSAMVHIGDDGPPNGQGNGTKVGSTNLACSGAETRTFTEDGDFKPGLDFIGAGTAQQGQAALLQQVASQHDVQLVLVSIGGNDFGFADVIEDCMEAYIEDDDYCSDDSTNTDRIDAGNVKTITGRITTGLQNVQKAMRAAGHADGSWRLVVNLNPDTLPLAGDFRYGETYSRWSDGGCAFYDKDAQWAGTSFVGTVRTAAQNALAASKITPSTVLDLSALLDNRELCAKGTQQMGSSGGPANWQADGAVDEGEWSNELRSEDSGPYFEQESLHPNYWAQLAARSCVRQLFAAAPKSTASCQQNGTGLTSRGEPVVSLR